MVTKERSGGGSSRRKRSMLSCLCLAASPVSDSADPADSWSRSSMANKPSSSNSWSRFRAKKKTVPLPLPLPEEEESANIPPPPEVSGRNNKGLFRMFHKDRRSKADRTRIQQRPATAFPAGPTPGQGPHTPLVCHVASKCAALNSPAPLHRVHDRSRTGTRTVCPGSPQAMRLDRCLDQWLGLVAVTVVLGLMVVLDRALAVVCMSACFYLVPGLKAAATKVQDSEEKKKRSSTHRKMMIDGRRTGPTTGGSFKARAPAG